MNRPGLSSPVGMGQTKDDAKMIEEVNDLRAAACALRLSSGSISFSPQVQMQLRAQYIQEFYQTVRDKWWVTPTVTPCAWEDGLRSFFPPHIRMAQCIGWVAFFTPGLCVCLTSDTADPHPRHCPHSGLLLPPRIQPPCRTLAFEAHHYAPLPSVSRPASPTPDLASVPANKNASGAAWTVTRT